jgi:hypothetical protein
MLPAFTGRWSSSRRVLTRLLLLRTMHVVCYSRMHISAPCSVCHRLAPCSVPYLGYLVSLSNSWLISFLAHSFYQLHHARVFLYICANEYSVWSPCCCDLVVFLSDGNTRLEGLWRSTLTHLTTLSTKESRRSFRQTIELKCAMIHPFTLGMLVNLYNICILTIFFNYC